MHETQTEPQPYVASMYASANTADGATPGHAEERGSLHCRDRTCQDGEEYAMLACMGATPDTGSLQHNST
jgi:hypothetical protein